jgi:hypothetical protein
MLARLQETLHPHPLRLLRVRFRRMSPQQRENKASTKMNSVATVQDKLHPLRLLQVRLQVRLRRMSQQRETGDPAGMDMIARLQEELLPLRHRRVWLRPMPPRQNEATDSVNSRISFPQAQRKIRNLRLTRVNYPRCRLHLLPKANTTRDPGPFTWMGFRRRPTLLAPTPPPP